jgi:hypothetical protein
MGLRMPPASPCAYGISRTLIPGVRHAGSRPICLPPGGRGIAGGMIAQDLAHEAIQKLMAGNGSGTGRVSEIASAGAIRFIDAPD